MKKQYKIKFNPEKNYILSNRKISISRLNNFNFLREGVNIYPRISLSSQKISLTTNNVHHDFDIQEYLERKELENEEK